MNNQQVTLSERHIIDATFDVFVPMVIANSNTGTLDELAKTQASTMFAAALKEAGHNLSGASFSVDCLSFTFEGVNVEGINCWRGLCSCKAELPG